MLTKSGADPPAKHHFWAPSRCSSDSVANWVLMLCSASVRALSGWSLLLSNSLAMHRAYLFSIESRRVRCILCYITTLVFCYELDQEHKVAGSVVEQAFARTSDSAATTDGDGLFCTDSHE